MEATTTAAANLLGPAARRCASATRTLLKHQVRTKATSARTRRALNIAPHPSFLVADSNSSSSSQYTNDTIIFNPPSSAASVYHTPFKFLPKTDPRRRANLASLFESHFGGGAAAAAAAAAANAVDASQLGPVVQPPPVFDRPPVTKEEVEEMRQLRSDDPHRWTVRALSEKFQIPQSFVMACCQAPKEKLEFERKKLELISKRWGAIKRKARDDREKRREMLFRGEI